MGMKVKIRGVIELGKERREKKGRREKGKDWRGKGTRPYMLGYQSCVGWVLVRDSVKRLTKQLGRGSYEKNRM